MNATSLSIGNICTKCYTVFWWFWGLLPKVMVLPQTRYHKKRIWKKRIWNFQFWCLLLENGRYFELFYYFSAWQRGRGCFFWERNNFNLTSFPSVKKKKKMAHSLSKEMKLKFSIEDFREQDVPKNIINLWTYNYVTEYYPCYA